MQNQIGKHHFTEDDKKKFIDFLNAVATHAKFELNTQQLCEYFKLLAHMQQVMLPKIDAHILEIKEMGKLDPTKDTKEKVE